MYDGIVNIYKEAGFTSHDVVAKLRGIYGQKKVGHTGTLDPMAEGVLIVVLGRATKLADLIITKRKKYTATMKLGLVTDTDDITGKILSEAPAEKVNDFFAAADIREVLENVFQSFIGKGEQIPPMYSAIKVNGKKLYEYAREGKTVELTPRPIEIYSLRIVGLDKHTHEVTFEVESSKGTYIRSLIRDMGEALGLGATMSRLVRDEINGIYSDSSFRLSDLQMMKEAGTLEKSVLKMDELLKDYPAVKVKTVASRLLQNGNPLGEDSFKGGSTREIKKAEFFRVYDGEELKALYRYDSDGRRFKVFKML